MDETSTGPGKYGGYELNYLENDCWMDNKNPSKRPEVFQRVSGFYQKDANTWDAKFCHFQVKQFRYLNDDKSKRLDMEGMVIGEVQYDMSKHIKNQDPGKVTIETNNDKIGRVIIDFEMAIGETDKNAALFNLQNQASKFASSIVGS